MEVLLELIGAIIAFIIEVTIHALVFIYLMIRAVFSADYRQKLRDAWDTSLWKRFAIVFGILMYSTALAIALFVWIPLIGSSGNHREEQTNDNESSITIEFTSEEVDKI